MPIEHPTWFDEFMAAGVNPFDPRMVGQPFQKQEEGLVGEKLSPKTTEYINKLTQQVNMFHQALKKKQAQYTLLEKEFRNIKVAAASLQNKIEELKDIIDSKETA